MFKRNRKSTIEEFIIKSKKVHGPDTYGYDKAIDYVNNKTKIELLCNNCKKYFLTRPCDHTSKKTGCPRCCITNSSKSERAARKIFESILKIDVSPASPKKVPWLLGLYLDGYVEDKKLAFEYQGYQHTIFPNVFHKTKEQFDRQVRNDRLKQERCIEKGVKVIYIPHIFTYKNKKLMKKFIIEELKKNNFI